MCSKWQQKTILLLEKSLTRETTSKLREYAQCKKQKQTTYSLSKDFIVCDLINVLFGIYQK